MTTIKESRATVRAELVSQTTQPIKVSIRTRKENAIPAATDTKPSVTRGVITVTVEGVRDETIDELRDGIAQAVKRMLVGDDEPDDESDDDTPIGYGAPVSRAELRKAMAQAKERMKK